MEKPMNCGTSFCSCIECVFKETAVPVGLPAGETTGPVAAVSTSDREPVAYAIFAENGNIRILSTEPPRLTDEEIVALAHRTATTYSHRSDPAYHSYGFVRHTLLDFARKVRGEA